MRAACVIGDPVKHSRSPLIHGHWIAQHKLDADYRREHVAAADFTAFVASLASHGYVGANVTIPHKEAALAASRPDDRARAVGAANTLWLDDGALRSTNTDVEGFLANLDASAPGWDRRRDEAVVLGAGGSARAIVYGLIERGFGRVHVVNRTEDRIRVLQERLGSAVHAASWDRVGNVLPRVSLLVNTTSLGMTGQPPLAIDLAPLSAEATVADIVYAPLVTPLLAAARARGLATADGLGMLLHQAVRGFALWFGVTPEVTSDLRAMIEADLTR